MDNRNRCRQAGRVLLAVLPFWLLGLTLRIATDSGAYYPLYLSLIHI